MNYENNTAATGRADDESAASFTVSQPSEIILYPSKFPIPNIGLFTCNHSWFYS
jgi:hypothetical protein